MHKEVLSGLFIKETICFCKIIERFNTIILIKMNIFRVMYAGDGCTGDCSF